LVYTAETANRRFAEYQTATFLECFAFDGEPLCPRSVSFALAPP